jgi:hypothetical protein
MGLSSHFGPLVENPTARPVSFFLSPSADALASPFCSLECRPVSSVSLQQIAHVFSALTYNAWGLCVRPTFTRIARMAGVVTAPRA